MLQLEWAKTSSDDWHSFDSVELDGVFVYGVYVIWTLGSLASTPSRTICVGQGSIAERIRTHRTQFRVTEHGPGLLVTWAAVPFQQAEGVEAFLIEQLRPLLKTPSYAVPIPVNTPTAA
jgi:hypothetical protein